MIFCQNDPKWKNYKLGTCKDSTIGKAGCYLTCLAQILENNGYNYDPLSLNYYFTNRAYINGCLLNEYILPRYFLDFKLLKVYHFEQKLADLSVLKKNSNEEIIICLDFDHNPRNGVRTHFVLLDSYDGNEIMISDPWTGKIENMKNNYGNNLKVTITKVIKYRKINKDLEFLRKNGIINSPEYWYPRLEEPMESWAVFALARRIMEANNGK